MPRNVEHFVPWRILWYVYQRLRLIQQANGYNCDAAVFLDVEAYRQSSDKFALLVYTDGETPQDQSVGGGNSSRQTASSMGLTIMGSIKYDLDMPARAQMQLEQDVRTALQTGVAGMRTLAGTGVSFQWGECQRFVTSLTAEREAGFSLTCSFLYPQGSTW